MAKKKYQSNETKKIIIMICLMNGQQKIAYKSHEYDVLSQFIEFRDLRNICQQFLQEQNLQFDFNIYLLYSQQANLQVPLDAHYKISVQQIFQKMNQALVLIIKGVIDDLKDKFQAEVLELKKQIQLLKEEVEQLKKPLKDNLELLRKNSIAPLPVMMQTHSFVEKVFDHIQLDIAILFSQPLFDRENKKNTAPAVDFRSEISRLSLALQNSFKPNIIMRCQIATFESLKNIIKYSRPKILHVICHGSTQGYLQFQQQSRNTLGLLQQLKPGDLKNILKVEKQHLPNLVFLNSCHSENVGKAFSQLGVNNIIMIKAEDPISDEASQIFSENFYRNIFKGQNVMQSFKSSKDKVQLRYSGVTCCCFHSPSQGHRQNCKWYKQYKKNQYLAHKNYHVPSSNCVCPLRDFNRHQIKCIWARKVLFQINEDFKKPPLQEGQEFRFPSINQMPDYWGKQLLICCCPPKDRRPHLQSYKFKLQTKDEGKSILMPVVSNRQRPQISDLTSTQLLEAHEKSKSIFGRQKQLFQFLRQVKDASLMCVYGKSGVGLTTFTIKASTYMMQRRIFQFFFFVDLYDIKDQIVFRYKFNQVTKFQYDGGTISQMGVKSRKILLLFDNCDQFLQNSADKFYKQIQNLIRQIRNCKVIITFKQESRQNYDQKKIIGQKTYQLLPFNHRAALLFLYSKIKDKTDISVGATQLNGLVKSYEVLRIPKVIQSLSQSIPLSQRGVKIQQLDQKIKDIKVSDTNKLTQSVLNQLKQHSKQAYQFLLFSSLFSQGVTFQDINMFSTCFRNGMSIQLPVRANWQQHYALLFQQAPTQILSKKQIPVQSPKFQGSISQMQIPMSHLQVDFKKIQFHKNQSSMGSEKQKKQRNQFQELDSIVGQSYFIDKNSKGRFIVKRFIRDFIWKKHENQTTNQIKFLYVAYFSVILELLFSTLKQVNYIHQDINTYSAISSAGIFSFKTTLQASYESRILTQSVRFAKQFINDLDAIFAKNEQLQQKMKKTDHSLFIMNHRQDFLKFYDTKWIQVFNYLKKKKSNEQNLFVIMLQNLMIYIPTAFKIANAESELLKYVLRGSQSQLKKLSEVSKPERSLKLQLKLCLIKIGVSINNDNEVRQIFGQGLNLIQQYIRTNDDRKNKSVVFRPQFQDIKTIFNQQRFTCDLIMDQKRLKASSQKQFADHLINRKVDFLKNNQVTNLQPIIRAKQGLLISSLFLKLLLKNPGLLLFRQLKQKDFSASIIGICTTSAKVFAKQNCVKLKLKADLLSIQLFWQFNQRFSFSQPNQIDAKDLHQIDYWRNKLDQCEADYFHQKNKLRGFTEFDDKIKQLKQQIKQKLWITASKRIIFMKAFPLSAKDLPIIKNLIRKKNNYRQEVQKILNSSKQSHKESSSSQRRIGLSPALKPKDSRLNMNQKRHSLDISTKYEILTRFKLFQQAKAKCSIMFITTDFKVLNNKVYFSCQNQLLQQDLVQINEQLAQNINMDNLLILVLSGINALVGMRKIAQLSPNPPIIIAINSQMYDNQQFDERHDSDQQYIRQFIKHENQVKQAELAYTKNFIKKITRIKIQNNAEVNSIHLDSLNKMKQYVGSRIVTAHIQINKCKKNIHLQYDQGSYRDLSPGYEGNHNIDSKSYENTVFIRRWRIMTNFFNYLNEQKFRKANTNGRLFLDPMSKHQNYQNQQEATYINIYGEVGCGKSFFIKQIAKIMVQRQFFDFGVFLFQGKVIQKNFNGDFELYIKRQASTSKMPVLQDFQRLLSQKTVLIIDDFHLIKPRVNARMKLFIDKILAKSVNLILVSLTQLKLDYLPKIKKIKMQPLDSFETDLLANNIIDINNQQELKLLHDVKLQSKKLNKHFTIKDLLDRIMLSRKLKKYHPFPYDLNETSQQTSELVLKKNHTVVG